MATDVAAGLPQVDLQPGSTITVTLDDAGAKITRLSVHGFQQDAAVSPSRPPSPVSGAYTTGQMADPETKSAIQADHAWAHFTKILAHNVPRHLHNAQTSWRKMAQLRRTR